MFSLKNNLNSTVFLKIKQNEKTLKLTNFPRNDSALGLFSQLKYLDNINEAEFQRELIGSIKSDDDLQKCLLASSEKRLHLQEEIDLQVTVGKFKNDRVRHQRHSLYKNVLRRQNPCEIVFKDISKFGNQKIMKGNFLVEIEGVNVVNESVKKLFNKAPPVKLLDMKQQQQSEKV